jgi:hydroxymethylpyrimidine/phosphomethylpyrimidine kinase
MTSRLLIIAGLDPSGNAGILRDAEIAYSQKFLVSAVATALTAQSRNQFFSPNIVDSKTMKSQLDAVMPLSQWDAIKIGMLGNERIVRLINPLLKNKNKPPIVVDPVLVSTSGGQLLTSKGRNEFVKILPLVTLWTPNLSEAEKFYGRPIKDEGNLEKAVIQLQNQYQAAILVKGLKTKDKIIDLLFDGLSLTWFVYPRLKKLPVRGTGCALSTLIACQLGRKMRLEKAVIMARNLFEEWLSSK